MSAEDYYPEDPNTCDQCGGRLARHKGTRYCPTCDDEDQD